MTEEKTTILTAETFETTNEKFVLRIDSDPKVATLQKFGDKEDEMIELSFDEVAELRDFLNEALGQSQIMNP